MTTTDRLVLSLRAADVDLAGRTIFGTVAPYNAVSYLVPDPRGERIMRGAFTKSMRERSDRVPLFRHHDHSRAVGMSREWTDSDHGLAAAFGIRTGPMGDEVLEEARDGYLTGLSVGFRELRGGAGRDGVHEVREAALVEVSVTAIPAYDGTALAVRSAQTPEEIAAEVERLLGPAPAVDLSPLPRFSMS